MQMLIALIVRVHCYSYISQHGFRTRCSNGKKLPRLFDNRIANFPQFTLLLFMYYFEITDGRLLYRAPVHDVGPAIDQPLLNLYRAPVHDVGPAIDQPLLMELYECFAHG